MKPKDANFISRLYVWEVNCTRFWKKRVIFFITIYVGCGINVIFRLNSNWDMSFLFASSCSFRILLLVRTYSTVLTHNFYSPTFLCIRWDIKMFDNSHWWEWRWVRINFRKFHLLTCITEMHLPKDKTQWSIS